MSIKIEMYVMILDELMKQAKTVRGVQKIRAGAVYVTMREKRDLVAQNKIIEILILVSRYNPPICCVKTLNYKTLYARRDCQPNLPYSSQAIEVKNEKTLIEVPLVVFLIFLCT